MKKVKQPIHKGFENRVAQVTYKDGSVEYFNVVVKKENGSHKDK